MTEADAAISRLALSGEMERARRIFEAKAVPPFAQFLVHVKPKPVERIVGALAWWRDGEFVKFALARLPGVDAGKVAEPLLKAFDEEIARSSDFTETVYFKPLAESDEWARELVLAGFTPTRPERIFEVPFATTYQRGTGMIRKFERFFPRTWRTVSITACAPEVAWQLVAPHRLVTLEALKVGWKSLSPEGFHGAFSSILFDATLPIGAFLVRVNGDRIAVDVRVVNLPSSRLRALGNLALFDHIRRQIDPQSLRVAVFRGDAKEHLETANMAFRMGGQEVARRCVFSKENCQRSALRLSEIRRDYN